LTLYVILPARALVSGYHRFNEIQRTIHDISARLLSNELKSLELNGLVKRVERSDLKRTTVEYQPTDYEETLKEVVYVMGNWGRKHKERITGKATTARL
jgi:DNA-binding HxlR family transcriptional regulator